MNVRPEVTLELTVRRVVELQGGDLMVSGYTVESVRQGTPRYLNVDVVISNAWQSLIGEARGLQPWQRVIVRGWLRVRGYINREGAPDCSLRITNVTMFRVLPLEERPSTEPASDEGAVSDVGAELETRQVPMAGTAKPVSRSAAAPTAAPTATPRVGVPNTAPPARRPLVVEAPSDEIEDDLEDPFAE